MSKATLQDLGVEIDLVRGRLNRVDGCQHSPDPSRSPGFHHPDRDGAVAEEMHGSGPEQPSSFPMRGFHDELCRLTKSFVDDHLERAPPGDPCADRQAGAHQWLHLLLEGMPVASRWTAARICFARLPRMYQGSSRRTRSASTSAFLRLERRTTWLSMRRILRVRVDIDQDSSGLLGRRPSSSRSSMLLHETALVPIPRRWTGRSPSCSSC